MVLREGFKKKSMEISILSLTSPPLPKVRKMIFYFFSIVDHYWSFFLILKNFTKYPKGPLEFFLLLEFSFEILKNFSKYPKGIFFIIWDFFEILKIFQNIQRGDPWNFFIIGDFFEILKIFPKYPKGGPLGFFFGGTPPKKIFLMHF